MRHSPKEDKKAIWRRSWAIALIIVPPVFFLSMIFPAFYGIFIISGLVIGIIRSTRRGWIEGKRKKSSKRQ